MDDDDVDRLLAKLDDAARDYDKYEYGLPIHSEQIERFRSIVRGWYAGLTAAPKAEEDEAAT